MLFNFIKKLVYIYMNSKIPKIVHQTFYTSNLPEDIVNIIIKNKRLCPLYKFIFYNDNDCQVFIKKNFDEKIFNAFMKINNCYGAMKADFFRYCVLYKIGGVYLDIKSSIKKPLGLIIKPDDSCLLDIPRNYLEPWRKNAPTYEQWLLIFEPKHPYLLEIINNMVNYIENNYEPTIPKIKKLNSKQKILHITGPDAFTKAINNVISVSGKLHRNINYNNYFCRESTDYIKMYTINNKKHYSQYNEPLYKYF